MYELAENLVGTVRLRLKIRESSEPKGHSKAPKIAVLTADESKRSDGCLLGAREPSEIDGVIC
jgi:hypothetical protein